MKKNVFPKSIQILIVTLMLLTVLVPRVLSQKLMIAAFILWFAIIVGYALSRNLKEHTSLQFTKKPVWYRVSRHETDFNQKIEETVPEKPQPTVLFSAENNAEQEIMLQHIALRITDKLKSAYPNTTWKWKKEPTLQSILSGSTHRIIVDDMEKYTHADISFDKFARIHIEPLILGTFHPSPAADNSIPEDDTDVKEPAVVDVKVWYEMVGQKILQTQITELNCKGHSKLTIKENGDIVIKKQGKDFLQTSLDAFPAKNYWQELISVLESDELIGKITENTLLISWN